jgi:hypothetical protein
MKDETLILYYYDDGLEPAERAQLEAELENDPALAKRYRELCDSLDRLQGPPPIQAPPAAVARWHRSIERAAASQADRKPSAGGAWHLHSFAWGAVAAALVLAVGVRLWLAEESSPGLADPPEQMLAHDPSRAALAAPTSFSRGLNLHLRESRQAIMRLSADGGVDRQLLIEAIMRQNRQFERAALEHDAGDVARVLRAFEPVLLRLASEDTGAEDAAALKAKLVFELNVVLTKMAAGPSEGSQSI